MEIYRLNALVYLYNALAWRNFNDTLQCVKGYEKKKKQLKTKEPKKKRDDGSDGEARALHEASVKL